MPCLVNRVEGSLMIGKGPHSKGLELKRETSSTQFTNHLVLLPDTSMGSLSVAYYSGSPSSF